MAAQHTIVCKNLQTAAVGVCSTMAGMLAIIMNTTSKSKLLPTYQAHNTTCDTKPAQLTDTLIMKYRNTSSKELSSEINTNQLGSILYQHFSGLRPMLEP